MFANLGHVEIIVIAVVIFLLFGGKKLPELARGISKASKEFNKGLKGEDGEESNQKKRLVFHASQVINDQKKKTTGLNSTINQNSEVDALKEYTPYIKELRKGFWKVLFFFAFGAVIGIVYYQKLLSLVMGLFKLEGINLVLTSPYQFIDLSINTGFFVGVLFAFPIFFYYFLQFTKPALKPEEFRLLISMLPISIILFAIGFIFGVWVLQYVVDLFSRTSSGLEIGNIWDLSSFVSQIIIMGLSLAFVFQMPVVITALLRLKIVSHKVVKKKRRVIYAGLLLFAAVLPPTDLVALALLTLIPLFLFEITLLLNRNIY